jgi:hypothetical protein
MVSGAAKIPPSIKMIWQRKVREEGLHSVGLTSRDVFS